MDAFLDILKLVFWCIFVFIVVVTIGVWIDISIDTYITTK